MNRRKVWTSLVCAIAPVSFAIGQFVDLNTEIEVSDWNRKSVETWTTAIHCIVGTNSWQMDGDFSRNARVTYRFTGTNLVEETIITKPLPEDFLRRMNQQPRMPFAMAPEIGTRYTNVFESVDGNPGRTVRQADRLTMVARIGWLAFCSSPCLKSEARNIFPPGDLWKELVSALTFKDRTTLFNDALGLPKTMDLSTTNNQQVMQYRVISSTNILGWELPLEFQLVQYRPAPVPERPGWTMGTNGWEVQFFAKGTVKSIQETTDVPANK
jgi:hypothetical protein